MKALCLPIVENKFVPSVGKTAITCKNRHNLLTVWANGDQSNCKEILVNVVVNEIGDAFVAGNDSKTVNTAGEPVFRKGEVVTRQKQTEEFKSFAGENQAAQFAQAANAFGLQLVAGERERGWRSFLWKHSVEWFHFAEFRAESRL